MPTVTCPWCQNEVPQDKTQEPERFCPFCENELGGYRTINVDVDNQEEDEIVSLEDDENYGWNSDQDELSENHPFVDEALEKLLVEQEFAPECPVCREYMLEVGKFEGPDPDAFSSRKLPACGKLLVTPPFHLLMFVCPSCYATQNFLEEPQRDLMFSRLSEEEGISGAKETK